MICLTCLLKEWKMVSFDQLINSSMVYFVLWFIFGAEMSTCLLFPCQLLYHLKNQSTNWIISLPICKSQYSIIFTINILDATTKPSPPSRTMFWLCSRALPHYMPSWWIWVVRGTGFVNPFLDPFQIAMPI